VIAFDTVGGPRLVGRANTVNSVFDTICQYLIQSALEPPGYHEEVTQSTQYLTLLTLLEGLTQSALEPSGYQDELDKLNKWLAKFHISVTPKSISAPNKFSNFAGAIGSSVTGLSIGASGITWAPAIVSYGPVGLSASATALSITPAVFSFFPAILNVQPQSRAPRYPIRALFVLLH
jgi:hypothetical protein